MALLSNTDSVTHPEQHVPEQTIPEQTVPEQHVLEQVIVDQSSETNYILAEPEISTNDQPSSGAEQVD